jgi:hypothetical protein
MRRVQEETTPAGWLIRFEITRTDNRHVDWIRTHRREAVILCGLITALGGLVIVLVLGQGTASWTGVEVTVPSCPADAQGCRLFVAHVDGTPVAHADWSGVSTTVPVQLAAGHYAISAEGCRGYEIENSVVSVQAGDATAINLGSAWQTPGFVNRTCPGFVATAPG